ncbi:hypothetical protein PsYK624_095120 [Phanerochaete sordida]|uniref:Uncharacterized protein n=1 Tax=Phanerochaete sordida TaxID=48140 RepID=A0A9P3GED0_9APHY|nr:hypothetical protein PsYK624_095120 [Phanerochaete sordida]
MLSAARAPDIRQQGDAQRQVEPAGPKAASRNVKARYLVVVLSGGRTTRTCAERPCSCSTGMPQRATVSSTPRS